MSSPEWQELERLWQGSPAVTAAKGIVARQHRRRWLSRLAVAIEIVGGIAGSVLSLWIMTTDKPDAVPVGVGTLLLSLSSLAGTLWARWPRQIGDASVSTALDAAVHRARVGVRIGLVSLWCVAALLFFTAFLTFLWSRAPGPALAHRFMMLGIYMAATGICQVVTILYYLRRARELARLQEIQRALLG
jgi:hypothetical protein